MNFRFDLFVICGIVLVCSGRPSIAVAARNEKLHTVVSEKDVSIFRGEALVLRYNATALPAPDPRFASYERSGYIHPVCSPNGRVVTGDFAPDHAHQHALFVAWTKTTYEGKRVDFWNQQKGSGIVLHDRVIGVLDDEASAGFQVAVKHCRVDKDGTPVKILDDVWTVRVRSSAPEELLARYEIEFSIAQTNVTDSPLVINEYHYGGVGFRGAKEWYSDEAADALREYSKNKRNKPGLETALNRFYTSEGKDRISGNHTRPQWAALEGLINGQFATIRVRSAASNRRHPVPVRLHPTKPYFSLSPCVLGEFEIAPQETYRATYVLEVIDGPHDEPIEANPNSQ